LIDFFGSFLINDKRNLTSNINNSLLLKIENKKVKIMRVDINIEYKY